MFGEAARKCGTWFAWGARAAPPVHDPATMQWVLQRERARADRCGQQFALALFRVKRRGRASPAAMRLLRIVTDRMRITDEAGWLNEQLLCVLLTSASAEGAWHFIEDVCARYAAGRPRPLCRVYVYPADATETEGHEARQTRGPGEVAAMNGIGHGNGNWNGNGNGNDHHHGNGHRNGQDADRTPAGGDHLLPFAVSGMTEELMRPAAQPLGPLLVRPLPRWKRLLDVTGAGAGMVAAMPFMLVIALLVKLSGPGPVLFRQQRAGLGGRPFTIYKFRTMTNDAEQQKAALRPHSEQDGPAFKMSKDPRVTRIGWLLRASSLDELPQLWNVLKGEMSLVGPRPLPIDESEACAQWQKRRLDVTPGLTCTWQTKGRSVVTFSEWMRMDLDYSRQRTLLRDLKLLAATVPAVLFRRGPR